MENRVSILQKRKCVATDDDERMPPRPKAAKLEYSSMVKRMMASMGYKPGEGLGKDNVGIIEPVAESIHKGRRGLGFFLDGLESEEVKWEEEEVDWNQAPEWLECPLNQTRISKLQSWIAIGEKKSTIADETGFCDHEILQKILSSKTVFDNLSSKEFLDARQRCNPFETIRGAIFQNRAAVKMANIDACFNFVFTNPKKKKGEPLLSPVDVLYFADICSGPGGFSEYVLWRKKWEAKGFGLTLKDPASGADFKLDQFLSAPCETFDPHYGEGGYDGDGDITKPSNLTAFKQYVMEQTNGKGVHFVMADGGISVEGQENIQEILTKQLVLCQYVCALSILREGGHFVCKVFDMFTPFSVGLFYLLYHCFHRICLFKPVTSRPANSERYIVCIQHRTGTKAIHDYLFNVNKILQELCENDSNKDVLEVVPVSVLQEDLLFASYVQSFNDRFGLNQILHLKKLQYFVKNTTLFDTRQASIRGKCLELWKVPTTPRTVPIEINEMDFFSNIWKKLQTQSKMKLIEDYDGVLNSDKFQSVESDTLDFLKDVYSWKWFWACGKRYLLLGLGRNKVVGWDMRSKKPGFSWNKDFLGLELPKGTMVEVECVQELTGQGSGQRKKATLYITDVISIYNEIVSHKPFAERLLLAQKLCKVVNKPCRKGSVLLKTKSYQRVAETSKHFDRLKRRACKGESQACLTISTPENEDTFVIVKGIIFVRHINEPWQLCLSKSGTFYYFNKHTRESKYDCPSSSVSPFLSMVIRRYIWMLTPSVIKDYIEHGLENREGSVGVNFANLNHSILQYANTKL